MGPQSNHFIQHFNIDLNLFSNHFLKMLFFTASVFALAALIKTSSARPSPDNRPSYGSAPSYADVPASYTYDWAVKDDYSNNNYGQTESRNGDKTTGSYNVLLPDGRTQTVTYSVDGYGGYVADITYSGEAKYPEPQKYKPTPSYSSSY